MRYLISVMAVAFATLASPTVADAAPGTVQANVTVRNRTGASLSDWTLVAQLAPGSHIQTVTGGGTARYGAALTVSGDALDPGQKEEFTVRFDGDVPRSWTAAGQACSTVLSADTSRLTVTCVVALSTPASIPGPPLAGGPPPVPVIGAAAPFAPYADMSGWPAPAFGDFLDHHVSRLSLGFVVTGPSACSPAWGGYGVYPAGGATPTNTGSLTRRAQAIAILQAERPLEVSFTLPVETTGLTDAGIAVVRNATNNGVALNTVNGMAMNFDAPNPAGHMGDFAIEARDDAEWDFSIALGPFAG